ncbi:hypothetical protein [Pseudomonas sp. S3E12]|uniref:hypothetical protein n=1 Tax=Pseudomonas sp. S3E12 TaxID=1873126 RepID=UPI00081BCC1E|nr:hypothetical protein [Pseudomonas sp. S3E12]OCW24024.1 hypothetical protein BB029_12965 [Pseudomonas sp. S3E12]
MLIRKLLKFESAHIVPGCSGQRCSATYEVEVLLGGAVLWITARWLTTSACSGLRRTTFIDAFDHALTL